MPGLSTRPKSVRLTVRKERPHPGAQLCLTDTDGLQPTCFATRTKGGRPADLALRRRRRTARTARTASAVPAAPARATCPCTTPRRTVSGWTPPPAHSASPPGCPCPPRPAEPAAFKPGKLRLPLFSAARLAATGRRRRLRFTTRRPWTDETARAIDRLNAPPTPLPLLIREGKVHEPAAAVCAPPLGLGGIGRPAGHLGRSGFGPGDLPLLSTDGVTEARDQHGRFCPSPTAPPHGPPSQRPTCSAPSAPASSATPATAWPTTS